MDTPDTLAGTTGCAQTVRFGAAGSRQVRVSTYDREGAATSQYLGLNVQPPPVNPYPRLLSVGVQSWEYVGSGGSLRICDAPVVASGTTIDLTQSGCTFNVSGPVPPQHYFAQVKVENPNQETLSYDWALYATRTEETLLSTVAASPSPVFTLHDFGNEGLLTSDCHVTLSINAPDRARNKGPLTVWTGTCRYHSVQLK